MANGSMKKMYSWSQINIIGVEVFLQALIFKVESDLYLSTPLQLFKHSLQDPDPIRSNRSGSPSNDEIYSTKRTNYETNIKPKKNIVFLGEVDPDQL